MDKRLGIFRNYGASYNKPFNIAVRKFFQHYFKPETRTLLVLGVVKCCQKYIVHFTELHGNCARS